MRRHAFLSYVYIIIPVTRLHLYNILGFKKKVNRWQISYQKLGFLFILSCLCLLETEIEGTRQHHLIVAVLTSSHNLWRFRAEIRKNLNMFSCNAQFYYYKSWCLRGFDYMGLLAWCKLGKYNWRFLGLWVIERPGMIKIYSINM